MSKIKVFRCCYDFISPSHFQDLSGLPFSLKHPHLVSWDYFKVARIKSSLIIRMIEQSIGRELLLQVFNKLISLASTAAQQKVQSESWFNLLLSTNQVKL